MAGMPLSARNSSIAANGGIVRGFGRWAVVDASSTLDPQFDDLSEDVFGTHESRGTIDDDSFEYEAARLPRSPSAAVASKAGLSSWRPSISGVGKSKTFSSSGVTGTELPVPIDDAVEAIGAGDADDAVDGAAPADDALDDAA